MSNLVHSPIPITIATAATTPLYFPLYLAKRKSLFEVSDGYQAPGIKESPNDENGDSWALDRLIDNVVDKDVLFAVCDPLATIFYRNSGVVVLATIISKAAFWLVDRSHKVASEQDFKQFDKVLTYPKGMSAYWIAKVAEERCGKRDLVFAVKRGSELYQLDGKSEHAAMTADIVAALELTARDTQYSIRYSWSEHSEYSNFMLTSLITTNETICSHPQLVHKMVRGIARAVRDVRMHQSHLADEFADIFGKGLPISKHVLDQLAKDSIYPDSTVPTISSWRSAYEIYAKQRGLPGGDEQASSEFSAFVRPEYAKKVELEMMQENSETERRSVEFMDRIESIEGAIKDLRLTEVNVLKLNDRLDDFARAIYACVNVVLFLTLGIILHWTSRKHLWTTPREVLLGFVVGTVYAAAFFYSGKHLKAIESWPIFQRLCGTWEKYWWGALLPLAITVAWEYFKAKNHLF